MPFQCLPDCGSCCGRVPFLADHYARVAHKAAVDHTIQQDYRVPDGASVLWPYSPADGRCAFLDRETKQCRTQDDKPEVCCKFGLSDAIEWACPWVAPDGSRRPRQQERRILRKTPNPWLRIEAAGVAS